MSQLSDYIRCVSGPHEEALNETIRKQRVELASANQELERLRAALEPFALLAPSRGGVNMSDPLSKWFTIAQLDAADAALSQREG